MILLAIIGMVVVGQTVAQALAGITLSTGEYIGKVGSFVIMGLIAIWLLILFFRNTSDSAPLQARAAPAEQPAQSLSSRGSAR
jgi:hypothetical protein